MKFALVNGQREEAQANLSGECPVCSSPMVAKCGEVRVRHWAHRRHRECDPWCENETEWHRNWKDQFPADWQEIVVDHSEDGERHIADVQTAHGWVIEFQHSPIDPGERRAREAFYPKLVWVVDGLKRKRDRAQILKAWEDGTFEPIGPTLPVRRVRTDECARLKEWVDGAALVFFDFGEQVLWWLLPKTRPNGQVYLAHFPRAEFVELHHRTATQMDCGFDLLVEGYRRYVADYEPTYDRRPHSLGRASLLSGRDFERDFARMSKRVLQGRFRPRHYRR